jgi:hypothetical protein
MTVSKKFIGAVVAAFVLITAFGYLPHGYLLAGTYADLPNLMRTADDGMRHMPYIFVGQFITAVALVWIYERGRQDKPWMGQGIRFGIAMAAFGPAAKFLIMWAVQQEPHQLAIHQICGESLALLITSMVVARIYA